MEWGTDAEIEKWRPFVRTIVSDRRWNDRVLASFCIDDREQLGLIGIAKALKTWNPEAGSSIRSWLRLAVTREIVDAWRSAFGRDGRRVAGQYRDADIIPDDEPQEPRCLDPEPSEDWDTILSDLPRIQARIIREYYFEHRTFAEIGRNLSITESRACQIHALGIRRLRKTAGHWHVSSFRAQ